MYCSKCGAKYEKGVKYCGECGSEVNLKHEWSEAKQNPLVKNYDTPIKKQYYYKTHKKTVLVVAVLALWVIYANINHWNQVNAPTQSNETIQSNNVKNSTVTAPSTTQSSSVTIPSTNTVTTPAKATRIDATELIKQYDGNVLKADSLYKGNTVEIVGTISNISNSWDKPSISINADTGIFGTSLICYFDKSQINSLLELQNGYRVIISGTVTGKIVGAVDINKCTLVGCEQLEKAVYNKQKAVEDNK